MPNRKRPSRSTRKRSQYVKFDGLEDFLKDMGVLPKDMKRAQDIFGTLAAATVVSLAKQNASEYGKPQQIRAAEDVRAIGQGTVQFGGKAQDWGAEFGAYVYHQFPEWRGNKDDAGYFLWPAIREFRDEDMFNLWVREVWTVISKLFSN